MAKFLRVIIMMVILAGIVGLAQSQMVGAASSSRQADLFAMQISQRLSPQSDEDCDKAKNQNSDKCRDKEKDKDKCKKNKKHCGSVKPPPSKIVISKTGEYSVGGLCTLSVVFNDPKIKLDARIKAPLPRDLPNGVQQMHQGCLLSYFSGNQRIDALSSASGNSLICFAATPKKQMTLYFYDIFSAHPKWTPLETTVQNGQACATGNISGVYVATFKKH